MVERLVAAGTGAYDHLEAEALRQRCEELEHQLSEFRNRRESTARP